MPVNFTGSYTENFDGLPTTAVSSFLPSTSSSTVPITSLASNWYAVKLSGTGNSATNLFVDEGTGNSGGIYSYGTSGTTERALGSVASGSTVPAFGVRLSNSTGNTITSLLISYTGEQWRSSTSTQNLLAFSYQIGATDLTSGTWTAVTALNFTGASPVTSNGALNGNTNTTSISSTITGLNIANNQEFWLRWVDTNDTGNDAGLAIDNFSISVLSPPSTPTVNLSVSSNAGTEAGQTVITVTATASSAVSGNQPVNLVVSGTNITAGDYTQSNTVITILNGATTGSVTFTVVDDAAIEGNETATLTISSSSAGITLGATTSQNITITDNDAGGSLSYSTNTLNEVRAFDGSIGDKIVITLTGGDNFVGNNGDNLITANKASISNVPAGLTPVLTLTSATTAELSFSGTATNHGNANDLNNISLGFNNSAFLGGNAAAVINSTKTGLGINFGDVGVDSSTQTFTPNAGTTVGSSDASTAIAFDANWMVVGDDEASVLRVYPREGGSAVTEWNFASALGVGTGEVDVEASTRIGDTLYFTGSHSNKKDGTEQLSRDNIFAVTVAGTGTDTQFTYQGKNTTLETALTTWDSSNAHGKGANYFGFSASSASGVIPEGVNGFSMEGMTASQDGNSLLLAFRAPQSDTNSRQNAVIVPVNVSGLLSAGGTNSPTFGTPIELDLGGRGLRSLEKAANGGDYLIIAGPAGSATSEVTNDFSLYRWDGVSTTPTELNVDLDSLLASTGGSFETLVDVLSTAQGTHVQLLQDNGDTVWNGQTQASKDLPASQQQFQGTWVTLGANVTDVTAPTLKISTPTDDATNVAINANLVLKFDEGMKASSGNFVIKNAGGNVVESIAANNTSKVTIAYNMVTINPTNDLVNSTAYYIEADNTALTDHSGNAWAGLTGNTAYNFTTAAPPPVVNVRITEVAPWSSGNSPVGADWFELTNTGTSAVDITGWKMDDNSNLFANAVALTGITSIAAGESVIFLESASDTIYSTFKSNWFGTNPPTGLQIGRYTGSGVGLSNSSDAVNIYDASGNLQANVAFNASPSTSPFATFDNGALANNATIATLSAVGTNGAFSVVHTNTEIGSPGVIAPVKIHDIQSSGATATLTGTQTIEGIVTRTFQGSTKLNGFYVQEEDADADANSATSEAIFVYDPNGKFTGAVGDKVQITGNVKEFTTTSGGNTSSLTELDVSAGTVTNKGASTLPSGTNVQLPVTSVSDLESYEGMLVNLSAGSGNLTVTENYQLGRYDQVVLAADGASNQTGTDARLDQYTQFNAPSVSGYSAYKAELAKRKIYLDDGSSTQNPDPILFARGGNPLSASNTLRSGDTVANITGILDERFEGYRIQTSTGVNFTPTNARPNTAPTVGGTLKVASFNVLNYFNDLDTGSNITTNGLTFQPRGANTASEFTRQRDKTFQAIINSGADVLGLMELENNGYGSNSAIQDLVNGLNAIAGAGTYTFINPSTRLGTDAINVGLIYQPGKVTPVGAAATMADGYGTGAFDLVGRKPLAQTFLQISTGEQFTAVVNHFKSKGSSAGGVGDADAGDGQGLSNGTRTRQAQDLATWLATKPTGTNDTDYLLLGDFNAYAKENPITTLASSGYNNLLPNTSYSYVFDGQVGALDHALGSASLGIQVTGAEKWHINADEPTILDYNTEFKSAGQVSSLYNADQFRASDHDPVIVGLNLLSLKPPITGGTTNGDGNSNIIDVSNTQPNANGTGGTNNVDAGAGNDYIIGSNQNDLLKGGNGNDSIFGNGGSDTLYGGNNDDLLNGGADNVSDILKGDAGADYFVINPNNKKDNIYFSVSDGDRFKLEAGLTYNGNTFSSTAVYYSGNQLKFGTDVLAIVRDAVTGANFTAFTPTLFV